MPRARNLPDDYPRDARGLPLYYDIPLDPLPGGRRSIWQPTDYYRPASINGLYSRRDGTRKDLRYTQMRPQDYQDPQWGMSFWNTRTSGNNPAHGERTSLVTMKWRRSGPSVPALSAARAYKAASTIENAYIQSRDRDAKRLAFSHALQQHPLPRNVAVMITSAAGLQKPKPPTEGDSIGLAGVVHTSADGTRHVLQKRAVKRKPQGAKKKKRK